MDHILIVDDSRTEVKIIKKILEKQAYQTSTASTGEEGIQKANTLHPDLILMDVIMPGNLNGYQATRQITTNPETKSIPIVIISSLDMDNDRAWGKMMGAQGYLVKPFNINELLHMISKLLIRKYKLNKLASLKTSK